MSDETASTEAAETVSDADAVAAAVAPTETEESKFEYVLDKYRTEGRTEQEALEIQAKSYTELNSKFGSFTGAPDQYEITVSEELAEKGVEFDSEDPLIVAALEYAKDANMSQEGLNGMLELYAVNQLGLAEAAETQKADEMAELGEKATQRLQNLSDWGNANLPPDMIEGFEDMATTAASVKALEHLVAQTRNAPLANNEAAAGGMSKEDVHAMQFELDKHGNRRIATDPEFRERFRKASAQVHGTHDHNVTIG